MKKEMFLKKNICNYNEAAVNTYGLIKSTNVYVNEQNNSIISCQNCNFNFQNKIRLEK